MGSLAAHRGPEGEVFAEVPITHVQVYHVRPCSADVVQTQDSISKTQQDSGFSQKEPGISQKDSGFSQDNSGFSQHHSEFSQKDSELFAKVPIAHVQVYRVRPCEDTIESS